MQPTAQAVGRKEEEDKAPKGRKKAPQPDETGPPDSRGRLSPRVHCRGWRKAGSTLRFAQGRNDKMVLSGTTRGMTRKRTSRPDEPGPLDSPFDFAQGGLGRLSLHALLNPRPRSA